MKGGPSVLSQTYAGIRVVELATTIAGPYCSMILADMGADVVKVERPQGGDDSRAMPPHHESVSTVYSSVNRNKRSVVLDLKQEPGKEAFLRLVETADVVVQSFRPGAAESLGLGFEALAQRNPTLIYCAVSAFGDSPSGRGRAGYDPLVQAFTGLMSMTGQPGGPPSRVAASLTDLTTGMWAALGVMAALARRPQTAGPQQVEATLLDSGLSLLAHQVLRRLATGEVPRPLGSASPITSPYEAFRTRTGWIMIAAGNQELWKRLCAAVGLPHLVDDDRFLDVADRVRHRDVLHTLIEGRLAEQDAAHWLTVIGDAGVPVGPVNDLRQALAEPVVAERGLLVAPLAQAQALPGVRLPIDDGPVHRPAPGLGEHTVDVLQELGLTSAEILRLTGS